MKAFLFLFVLILFVSCDIPDVNAQHADEAYARWDSNEVPITVNPGDSITVVKVNPQENLFGYIQIKTYVYPVYCGKTNTDCSITGSLFIDRVRLNGEGSYKYYLSLQERDKIRLK